MTELGKVFMLDEDKVFLAFYRHFLESKGYNVFTTDNPYQLLLYGRELKPDIIFLDIELPHHNEWEYLQNLNIEPWAKDVPIAVLSPETPSAEEIHQSIAHVLPKKMALHKIVEIIESYCQGNKEHDFFILSDYSPSLGQELRQAHVDQSHAFVAHDLRSAKRYLSKNHPHKIVIKYPPEKFEEIKNELPKKDVYRVDSFAELEQLNAAS